jgi:hypothetical protein
MSHFCILLDNKLLQTPCVFILTSSFFCQSLMKNQYAARWYLFVDIHLPHGCFKEQIASPLSVGHFRLVELYKHCLLISTLKQIFHIPASKLLSF